MEYVGEIVRNFYDELFREYERMIYNFFYMEIWKSLLFVKLSRTKAIIWNVLNLKVGEAPQRDGLF